MKEENTLNFTTHKATPIKKPISFSEMNKLKIQVGQVKSVKLLKKARNPSYEMALDFNEGEFLTTCGQFVNNYTNYELNEKQVLGVTNFPPRRIAGVKSQVLTLGFADAVGSHQAICLQVLDRVPNGMCVNFANPSLFEDNVVFDDFLALEIRSGTIETIQKRGDHTWALVDLGEMGQSLSWIPGQLEDSKRFLGQQVATWLNPQPFELSQGKICESVLLVAPLQPYESDNHASYQKGEVLNTPVTLIVASKKVNNGFELF